MWLHDPLTSFSSPNKDLPVPLGELLSWVSDISRSWMGSRGAPEAAAARPCSPAQCGWMSIPPPLIAAMEPVPRPEAGGTAPEDTGTSSLTLCTCQSPQPETGATVPKQPMAQEASTGSPGPHLPHTLPPPRVWPPGVVSGSLRISKTSPPSHLLSSAACKSSHVTLCLWCHYCSHYPVWLCMRCHCARLQGSPHSWGPPHPDHRSSGQWGSISYPNTSLFWGKTLNLYILRSVCKRSSVDPGLPCKGSKGESSETSWQLCVVCSPLGLATVAVGSHCLLWAACAAAGRDEACRGAKGLTNSWCKCWAWVYPWCCQAQSRAMGVSPELPHAGGTADTARRSMWV
ncbi:PREDICTED: uncharacterized protein LOC108448427 isoform X2 [Corvus brachyrhynchos]|uniref:uncharacterized protein LOC108448427 isoform X2 n=1 Tax=Corvus brachyrhynchos TaxID=85066 RepID=UPI00081667AE|nr:PREDICTED: uncharacterized protein LOC108448427 isoform X2 [Corvus brachyrhynchos]